MYTLGFTQRPTKQHYQSGFKKTCYVNIKPNSLLDAFISSASFRLTAQVTAMLMMPQIKGNLAFAVLPCLTQQPHYSYTCKLAHFVSNKCVPNGTLFSE
jgi:hypothetical protein